MRINYTRVSAASQSVRVSFRFVDKTLILLYVNG